MGHRMWRAAVIVALASLACGQAPNAPRNSPSSAGRPRFACPEPFPVERIVSSVDRDQIPSIEEPEMIPATAATYLSETDLVLGLDLGDDQRAYPYRILNQHEIVKDVVNGRPLTITYCPLTGSGLVFDNQIQGRTLDLGVSGLLFDNNLIMFDRMTRSTFSQMWFCGIDGAFKGMTLSAVDAIETTWGAWKVLAPRTRVLSTNTGIPGRDYFFSPYDRFQYTTSPTLLFPLSFDDTRLARKDRVHGVIVGNSTKAYPLKRFTGPTVLNDQVNGVPLLIVAGGAPNLIVSFLRTVGERTLTFMAHTTGFPMTLVDQETRSTWTMTGRAVDGPLAGTTLQRPLAYNAYWFAWGAFFRGAELYQ